MGPLEPSPSPAAVVLSAVSLLCVLALVVLVGEVAWADSGSFALVLFGIPVVSSAGVLWIEFATGGLWACAVSTALAAISLAWSLVTGLGLGLYLLLPSSLLVVAVAVSFGHRLERSRSRTS